MSVEQSLGLLRKQSSSSVQVIGLVQSSVEVVLGNYWSLYASRSRSILESGQWRWSESIKGNLLRLLSLLEGINVVSKIIGLVQS